MLSRRVGLTFLCALILTPSLALAQTASTLLSANVPSPVSVSLSTLTADLSELPADGVSSVMFTATVVDSTGAPLASKDFTLASNRGEVENIRCYDGNTLLSVNKTQTDALGIARCIAYSLAPGQATFTGTADSVDLKDKPTVTFTPLPVISNLTVVVELPGNKKITLVKPTQPVVSNPAPKTQSAPSQNKLVNTQVELAIPFWVFLLIILLLITSPFLFSLLVIIYRRLRFYVIADKQQREKEESLLAQIFALEQKLAQGQTVDLQQNQKISQQIAQSEQDVKQTVIDQAETPSSAP